MPPLKDLTGQVFGRLTVLYRAENHISPTGKSYPRWHCRCECGNEVDVTASALQRGRTKSCGCYQRERASASGKKQCIDLTGQVFGRLTVLYRAENYMSPVTGNQKTRWHCRCECGNEVDVAAQSLRTGRTTSCGCYRRKQVSVASKSKLVDLTGCVVGRLTVLYRAEDYISSSGNRIPKWHCRCECGKEVDVISSQLKNGRTQSCGCYQRERASAAAKRNLEDLTGRVFGRLTVLYRAEDYIGSSGTRIPKWHCRCECGNEVDVIYGNLRSGKTKSCGCTRASKKRQA